MSLTGNEILEVYGVSATGQPSAGTFQATTAEIAALAAAPTVAWAPSDITGSTDVTSELEAFVAANQGAIIKVYDGAIIKLKNAFKNDTTNNILIDFGKATIVYDHNTVNDAAIYLDNTANADSERTVNSIALATVNTDATVTQLTFASKPNVYNRFDWIAFYTSDANPAKPGGYYGEIFQLLMDENPSTFVNTATRKLNLHDLYSGTGMKARRLDASRKVYIRGGTFTANGVSETHSITTRSKAIICQGFVDPEFEDILFLQPWAECLRLICNAAPKIRNTSVRNVGNLANYNGFIYLTQLYGMNDCADIRGIVTRNGRHSGFTTDGNSSSTTTWYLKGIPTNFVVDGVHGYNCHASVVDTHEEGNGGHITNVSSFHAYQDGDISPNFTGLTCQIRCANVHLSNVECYGGTHGIKVNAVDHGFEDHVWISNVNMHNFTTGATTDSDIGVTIDDQSALTNKRKVFLNEIKFDNVSVCVTIGKASKVQIGNAEAHNMKTWIDRGEGAELIVTGNVHLDFSNNTHTAPYSCNIMRDNSTLGGGTAIYLRKPFITKGAGDNQPTEFFDEHSTGANKTIWCPGIREYNPGAYASTALYHSGATTFSVAPITDAHQRVMRIATVSGASITLNDSDDVVEINNTSGGAVAVNIPAPGIPNRTLTIKDGGAAASNNLTITPGLLNHALNGVFSSTNFWTAGTGWAITGGKAVATSSSGTLTQTNTNAMIQLISGRAYTCQFTTSSVTGGSVALSLGAGTPGTSRSTSNTFTQTITAGATQDIVFTGTGFSGSIDNLTITPNDVIEGALTNVISTNNGYRCLIDNGRQWRVIGSA